MPTQFTGSKIWDTFIIESDKTYSWQIEKLQIWCIFKQRELVIAYSNNDEFANSKEEIPDSLSMQRWSITTKQPKLKISPIFPDRPVVVKPEAGFRIVKKGTARIYVRVPIWVKIELEGRDATTLIEIPIVTLSNTWFGSFIEGELCYWISSSAAPHIEPDASRPYSAICPIAVNDKSDDNFTVEKICLHVENLSIFDDGEQLWSDEIRIQFEGIGGNTQIKTSGNPPQESPKAQLVGEPRKPLKRSFTAKTFATLKELPGLGIVLQ